MKNGEVKATLHFKQGRLNP